MSRSLQRLCTLGACIAVGGCAASASSQWDSTFGDATRQLTAQQIMDPAAPTKNGTQVPPADGRAVREATGHYVATFRAPPPAQVINIGVSTNSGGGTPSGQ
jgi:hypothetical protein